MNDEFLEDYFMLFGWHKAQLALFVIQQGTGCLTSATFDMETCCSNPAGKHLGYSCWDGDFSRKHCCGHLSEMSRTQLKPSDCWTADFNFEKCCSTRDAGSLIGCWDFRFGYEQCCVDTGSDAMSAESMKNLTALLAAKSRGMCDGGSTLRFCRRMWQQVLAGAPKLTSKEVLHHARHLAEYWRSNNLIDAVAKAAPGFAASIGLHAAAYVFVKWQGGLQLLDPVFTQTSSYLKLYRENIGRIDVEDMMSKAGGLRLADLDEAISILVQSSYITSLDIVQRDRIVQMAESRDREILINKAYQGALAEAIEALDSVQLDYVPSQGTLISLLRILDLATVVHSSSFFKLVSNGWVNGWDVVDNDAELMVFVGGSTTWQIEGTRLSLELQDSESGTITNGKGEVEAITDIHSRHGVGEDPSKEFILSDSRRTAERLELLYHWNSEEGIGEYVSQALSQATSQFQDDSAALLGRSIQVLVHQLDQFFALSVDAARRSISAIRCIALPVISQDRDFSDPRNERPAWVQKISVFLEELAEWIKLNSRVVYMVKECLQTAQDMPVGLADEAPAAILRHPLETDAAPAAPFAVALLRDDVGTIGHEEPGDGQGVAHGHGVPAAPHERRVHQTFGTKNTHNKSA
ncbi:unnamed protein product [Symbiodinium natans]|uniref:Uncharacterized protein n=1 Tax=Symbiodinium natans TaxID=878477 RepID=A0A812UDQ8_9DINO|nr:unnamed protein product [Symbiodinium natans]